MKIALLQSDLRWESAEINRELAEAMIEAAGEADLFLLPEMFTTGFAIDPAGVVEKAGGETPEWMSAVARKKGAAIAGSIAVEDEGRLFNRFYFAVPDGRIHVYDKRHLFSMGGEKTRFSAGGERIMIEYMDFRIMPLVCYDLRFPVWSRAGGHCDLILYTANWPAPRINAWDTLLRARAIENQCYVAGANRVGRDPYNEYNGHSAVVDFMGNTLAEAPEAVEAVVMADVSREELDAFRTQFPAWMDADKFELK